MVPGFVIVWAFIAGDDLGGADEFVVGNGPDDGKTQSSLSEPIIGKLAKIEGAIEGCTGELKFCVFLVRLEKDVNILLKTLSTVLIGPTSCRTR